MDIILFWFGIAGLALIIELLINTFYLLLISFSMLAAGFIAMFFPKNLLIQILTCCLIALICLFFYRRKFFKEKKVKNQNLHIDIGQLLIINDWSDQGLTNIYYRGTTWQVEMNQKYPKRDGVFVIIGFNGNRIVVVPL